MKLHLTHKNYVKTQVMVLALCRFSFCIRFLFQLRAVTSSCSTILSTGATPLRRQEAAQTATRPRHEAGGPPASASSAGSMKHDANFMSSSGKETRFFDGRRLKASPSPLRLRGSNRIFHSLTFLFINQFRTILFVNVPMNKKVVRTNIWSCEMAISLSLSTSTNFKKIKSQTSGSFIKTGNSSYTHFKNHQGCVIKRETRPPIAYKVKQSNR